MLTKVQNLSLYGAVHFQSTFSHPIVILISILILFCGINLGGSKYSERIALRGIFVK
jgi:hypothetical protein